MSTKLLRNTLVFGLVALGVCVSFDKLCFAKSSGHQELIRKLGSQRFQTEADVQAILSWPEHQQIQWCQARRETVELMAVLIQLEIDLIKQEELGLFPEWEKQIQSGLARLREDHPDLIQNLQDFQDHAVAQPNCSHLDVQKQPCQDAFAVTRSRPFLPLNGFNYLNVFPKWVLENSIVVRFPPRLRVDGNQILYRYRVQALNVEPDEDLAKSIKEFPASQNRKKEACLETVQKFDPAPWLQKGEFLITNPSLELNKVFDCLDVRSSALSNSYVFEVDLVSGTVTNSPKIVLDKKMKDLDDHSERTSYRALTENPELRKLCVRLLDLNRVR